MRTILAPRGIKRGRNRYLNDGYAAHGVGAAQILENNGGCDRD